MIKRFILFIQDIDYELACVLLAFTSVKYLFLALFLGVYVNPLFALFFIGFPLSIMFWVIIYTLEVE